MEKKSIILFLLGLILVVFAVFIVMQGNKTSSGKFSQYYQGSYKEAYNKLLNAAEKGDAIAQVDLGNLYLSGQGIKQDYNKAYYWFQKSAKQNNPNAIASIASMYKDGIYLEININKAIELYNKAISINNDSMSKYNLAIIYLNHKPNALIKKGLSLLEESAKQNNSFADAQLGLANYLGLYGITVNYSNAMSFTEKAAKLGNPIGQNNLALFYYEGKALEKDDCKAYFWFYVASEFGKNPKSKQLIDSYHFNLTELQKEQAINDAKQWGKKNKEMNFDLIAGSKN